MTMSRIRKIRIVIHDFREGIAWAISSTFGICLMFFVISAGANITWWAYSSFSPVEWWLEVSSTTVSDAVYGEVLTLEVDRKINSQFRASRSVSIDRRMGSGPRHKYLTIPDCQGSNSNNYTPDSALPSPITIDWWMGLNPWNRCDLRPGTYRLETYWELFIPNFPLKSLYVVSNDFTVLPFDG